MSSSQSSFIAGAIYNLVDALRRARSWDDVNLACGEIYNELDEIAALEAHLGLEELERLLKLGRIKEIELEAELFGEAPVHGPDELGQVIDLPL